MTDVPDDVADVFDARETFVPGGSGYVVETTSFEGHVTASEGEKWRTDYEVTVRAPTLQAATADDVGPAVRDGWFETFERRLEDAPKATRVAVDLDDYTVEEDGEEVVVTYRFSLGGEREAADVAKTFVEYVEGTYVEGIVPGYDYVGVVADLLSAASTGGSEGSRGGTPL
ncbi:DUF5813 family protein [Haloarcula salinisoli]|uniref:Uncharacterized protein n=1 Tax=Haloarcula salinisoli TaxID=2487746 RepID=A0A8J7YKC6_9EURY|nr:DUF5813 family protein [Halomicroarcula salinisoli]MBX0287522.1 hypothetical protein [Halomicroarcula salinisoli]MBX0304906.1 hypothetical protein [Halomicroarcula salinisoli]